MAKSKLFKKLDSYKYESLINILIIVIVILFLVNTFFSMSLSNSIKSKLLQAEEASRPANLQLTVINADCNNCYDINKLVDTIKSGNVNISEEKILSLNQASDLIRKYNINKLPTVIINGELDKSGLNSTFEISGDSLIFTNQTPPYYDVNQKRIRGLVTATLINPDNCLNCTNLTSFVNQLKTSGVVITKISALNEKDGINLIKNYNINKLPVLILSSDASEYSVIKQNWATLGTEEIDGNLVMRDILPPYKNLSTGKIDGLVNVTYLIDSSCTTCYDVNVHKKILNSYGIIVSNEKTLDVNSPEGLSFAQKNNITLVPTVVLSSDAKLYTSFYRVFMQVAKEENGNLIFTSLGLMGNYKDLVSGKEITPQKQ